MAAMPAPVIRHKEDAKLVSQCLDFCQTLAGKSLTLAFSLTIGTNFAFSVDTMGNGTLASKEKKKKPTPSAMRRNARRREEFLNKKRNTSTAAKPFQSKPAAAKEAEAPANAPSGLHHHPSPSPSSERRQVITVGREKEVPTFSQLDGAPPVAAAKPPSHSSAASSPASPPSRPYEEHQGGEGAAPGRRTESDLGAGSLRRSESPGASGNCVPPTNCSASLSPDTRTAKPEPSQIQFGPRNGLRPNWGRGTKKA